MWMTVIAAWNLLCKTVLHLLTPLVFKTSHCKSLNKCPQNRMLPLDSALGKTNKAKTSFCHILEKGQQNWAILGLVANLFLKISFLLKKVNNLHLTCAPNLASSMMFWEVNQKPLPFLNGGVSHFGYPASCRCPSKPNAAQINSTEDDLVFTQSLALFWRHAGTVPFPSPAALVHSKS